MSARISTGSPPSRVSTPLTTSLAAVLVDARHAAAHVLGAVFLDGAADELVVVLPGGADVHVEDRGLAAVHLVLVEHRVLGGVHAADLGAVGHALGRSRLPAQAMKTTVWGVLPSDGRLISPPVGPEAEARRSNFMPSMTSVILAVAVFARNCSTGMVLKPVARTTAPTSCTSMLVLLVEADRLGRAELLAAPHLPVL